jgi:hypothetical protein
MDGVRIIHRPADHVHLTLPREFPVAAEAGDHNYAAYTYKTCRPRETRTLFLIFFICRPQTLVGRGFWDGKKYSSYNNFPAVYLKLRQGTGCFRAETSGDAA